MIVRPPTRKRAAHRVVAPVWKYPADDDAQVPQARHSSPGIPRYTLTAFGNRIYARLGSQSAAYFSGTGSRGVELDRRSRLEHAGKTARGNRARATLALPNRPPDRNNNRTISFEGTPVADGGSVYVGGDRSAGADGDLHRLFQRRFGRRSLGQVRGGRFAGRRQQHRLHRAGCRRA